MHTEDEAKQLTCPMKLRADNSQTNGAGIANSRCEGSQCMAWRWVVSSQEETHYLGFCGMASRPFD